MDSLKEASRVLFVLSAVLAFFVLITIISFLSIMIKERTKEIGIMRALGATNGVTLKVFYIELGIISAAVTLISSLIGARIINLINTSIGSVMMSDMVWIRFGILNLLVCAAVFTAFLLLTAFPLLGRLSRRQPIDVINTI